MKNFLKRTVAVLMVVLMCIMSVPMQGFVGLELPEFDWFNFTSDAANDEIFKNEDIVYGEDGTINRIQWLHNLTVIFDLTVKKDNLPDNYYADLEEDSEFYKDAMIATEYGLIDIEAGGDLEPTKPATRDFAAFTLNKLLGFVNEGDIYSFTDTEDIVYDSDAQIAVDRGWFALISGKFMPEQAVTKTEAENMYKDAAEVLKSEEIDEEAESKFEFTDDVTVIDNDTLKTIEDDKLTLFNYTDTINVGDVLAVFQGELPALFKAEKVEKADNKTIVTLGYCENGNYVKTFESQGSSVVDLETFEPAEGATVEYIYEESDSAARGVDFDKGKNYARVKVTFGDWFEMTCTLRNLNIEHKVNFFNESCMVKVVGNVSVHTYVTASVSTHLPELPSIVEIGSINFWGVGKIGITVPLKITGSLTNDYEGSFEAGFDYSNDDFRMISKFRKTLFTSEIDITASAGIKLFASIDILGVAYGSVYIEYGLAATYNGYYRGEDKTPKKCETTISWLYAKCGANASLGFDKFSKSYSETVNIYDKDTSPGRTYFHYEDGKMVPGCTVSASGKRGYYTKYGSRYGMGKGGYGYDAAGKPYAYYDYTLNEDKEATITAYKGNVTALHIPETIDGYKVVAIGKGAFEKQNGIRSVVIPNSVTSIGAYAFGKCVNLSFVSLSENLTSLGSSAFYNCDGLIDINIPASIKDVPSTQKYDYPSMTYGKVFAECDNLKTVTFSEGITNIPGIFNSCTSIQTIEIPNTVTSIDNGAFEKCSGLVSVNIPNSVTKIGCYAFGNCINLTDIVLPKNLETLGSSAFYNCDSLTSITIPLYLSNVPSTQKYDYPSMTYGKVFAECDNLKMVIFAEGITHIPQILNCCVSVEKIELPYTVTTIGDGAFESCSSLKTIVLPESIIRIGGYAFGNCTSLEDIILPRNLNSLGSSAFYNCDSLSTITIPAKTVDFPSTQKYDYPYLTYGKLFAQCDNLKTVVFENGRKSIPKILNNCTSIESLTIPNSVESIESGAFYNCKSLKSIEYNTNVVTIGDEVFYNCTSLSGFNIKESITSIGTSAFAYSGLETIEIPENVKSLGAKAFLGCEKLKEATVADVYIKLPSSAFEGCIALEKFATPKSLQTISNNTFKNCTSLKEITLNDGLTTIGEGSFQNCDALTTIDLPNSVKSIGKSAFYDCDILEKVTLGNSLEAISNNTFEHCDVLSEIVLPYRVASIGSNAFKDCVKFTSITIPRATTKIADNVFSYLDRLTIYGVEGTYAETYAKEKGIKFVNKAVPATKVELSETELSISKGATANLVLNITPTDFTDAVAWKSSDESIVTIDDTGKVNAKGIGSATIKVDVGSVSATCKVTVVQPVTKVNIDKSSVELEAHETVQLKVTVSPDNAANKAVKWSTSDETIATVDQNGLVKAFKKGSATIKCEALDGSGKYDTCTVNVKNNGVIAVTVSELESTHDYPVECTDFWQYTVNGASKLDVTFDSRTNIEDGFDYLYIYDGSGKEVGKYTGTSLAGKTITVSGDTVRIQLASDKSGTAWGFKVTDVKESAGIHTHSYTETVTKAATCTGTGIKTFTCTCGDTYTEVIPATGHKNVTSDSGKAPTTTEVGYTAGKYCNDCKTWIEGHNEIPKVDDTHTHKYSSKVTKEATCTENGVRTYTCSCGDSYTESIDKIEHKYVTETWKATLTTNGGYKKLCKYCGKITGEGIYYSPEVIKLSTEKYTYDGKTKKPSVFVEDKMGVDFKEGTDYTVKYESGRKAPGKYTVTITFIGKYEGKKVLEFKILPGKISKITATQSTSAIKLTWKKVTGADGYRVYQYNSKTGKYEKIKTTSGTTYTIKKLKAGTTYKFAVKAYTKDNGETFWAASSKSIKTATEPAVPNVKITAGTKKATLKWNKVTGATGYVVYMKNSDDDYVKLGSTKSTSYTKKSLKSGKKYYFRVRAYKTVDGKNIYGGYKTYSVKVK